jgi:hypothetical protein
MAISAEPGDASITCHRPSSSMYKTSTIFGELTVRLSPTNVKGIPSPGSLGVLVGVGTGEDVGDGSGVGLGLGLGAAGVATPLVGVPDWPSKSSIAFARRDSARSKLPSPSSRWENT